MLETHRPVEIDLSVTCFIPANIEWDLPNGPLSTLLELLDTQV